MDLAGQIGVSMKGFMHLTEAIIAIMLLMVVLNAVQSNIGERYEDFSGTYRLKSLADSLVFSVCNDQNVRQHLVNNDLTYISSSELDWALPKDVSYKIVLYSQGGNVIGSIGYQPSEKDVVVTSSCLISGYMEINNMSNYSYAPRKLVAMLWNR